MQHIRLYNLIRKWVKTMSYQVVVTLTDAEYDDVVRKAENKAISIAQYVKKYPISVDEFDVRYEYLKNKALEMPIGEPFTVMSIFEDWNCIPRGIKLSLGRNFYHYVKRGELTGVEPVGKNSSNVQLYARRV